MPDELIGPWSPRCGSCGGQRILGKDNTPPEPPRAGRKPGPTPVMAGDMWSCRTCETPWDGGHLTWQEFLLRDTALALGA
jgi:hypothetical protein